VDENFGLVEVSRGLRYKVKAQSGLYDGGLLVVRNGVNDDGSWVRGLVTLLICRVASGPAEWLGVPGSTDQESARLDKQKHVNSSKFEVFDISTSAGYLTFAVCSSFKLAYRLGTELTLCKPLMCSPFPARITAQLFHFDTRMKRGCVREEQGLGKDRRGAISTRKT
jgi:hypothetical protein